MAKVPIIICAAETAEAAFHAHKALLKAEAADPSLRRNPFWTLLRQDAYERFSGAYAKAPE